MMIDEDFVLIVDTTLPSKLNLIDDLIDKTSEMMIDEDFVLIVDTTLPSKLNLIDDLIDKTSEMMTDEDFVLSEIQKWTMETRHTIEEKVNWTKRENQWSRHTINKKLMRPKPK